MTLQKSFVGALSVYGGKKDCFYLACVEHFAQEQRYFLSTLQKFSDQQTSSLAQTLAGFNLPFVITDLPLDVPPCSHCTALCQGLSNCTHPQTVAARECLQKMLLQDRQRYQAHPKSYERQRAAEDLKEQRPELLSRSLRRRCKRGFNPYWHRPIDVYIWSLYFDQLQRFFKTSYDSFGNTSLMVWLRFLYWQRHLPEQTVLWEGRSVLVLLALLQADIIKPRTAQALADLDRGSTAKLDVIRQIERHLNFFIYDRDLEVLIKEPKAFDSFLLALAAVAADRGQIKTIPSWAASKAPFILPEFVRQDA